MATKVNRAATATSKKGGRPGRRNRTTQDYDTRKKLLSPKNQEVFEEHSRETKARNRNQTAGLRTRRQAPGIGGLRFLTQQKNRISNETPRVDETEAPKTYRVRKRPSGRGISGGKIHITGSLIASDGSPTAARRKPKRGDS